MRNPLSQLRSTSQLRKGTRRCATAFQLSEPGPCSEVHVYRSYRKTALVRVSVLLFGTIRPPLPAGLALASAL